MNIKTIAPRGLEGKVITIEIDYSKSLPGIDIIGLPDSSVKESIHRLRATFRTLDISIPPLKYIINLAPSDLKKIGAGFDLPIATALLLYIYSDNIFFSDVLSHSLFLGELSLHGDIKPIPGILSLVLAGKKQGYTHFFIPKDSLYEVECIPDITIYPCDSFSDIVSMFIDNILIKPTDNKPYISSKNSIAVGPTFDDIIGHEHIKRALAIAACGFHNILMIGPPGSGKSMLAKAVHSLLPPLQYEESIEVSHVYSVGGGLEDGLLFQRPFRSVHHTITKVALLGGGASIKPGEISYAHRGVLFLDEIAEFPRDVLDTLRQPMEDKYSVVSRLHGSVIYPADCMVIGAMNPCVCGHYNDEKKICTCTVNGIKKYQSKISGPLLDRFDIVIHVPNQEDILLIHEGQETNIEYNNNGISSITQQISDARNTQKERHKNRSYISNSGMSSKDIQTTIPLKNDVLEVLSGAQKTLGLSHRAVYKIIKVARSIADYEKYECVEKQHILEAIQYRGKGLLIER